MKKIPVLKVATLAVIGFVLGTGCSSTRMGTAGAMAPASALSFSPVTDPVELSKWQGIFQIRSIESYTFVAPATVDVPVETLPAFSETLPPGSLFVEAAGGEMRPYRVIRHAPHLR